MTADAADASERTIRVALAEDSPLMRSALESVLSAAGAVEVVSACEDRDSLLAAVEAERPDVVVTDIRMPPSDRDEGLQVAAALRRDHPQIGVVLLSQFAEPRYGIALFEHGSERRAYLLKERTHHRGQLVSAIRTVANGGSVIDAKVIDPLIAEHCRDRSSPLSRLSHRELDILGRVACGQTDRTIADELSLSRRVVEQHVDAIFRKLGVIAGPNASQLVKVMLIYLSESGHRQWSDSDFG
jgi:DNA-binding NarL/FixJ family response regulator